MRQHGNLLYAELLANICQVSIIAALDSPSNSSTTANLSADGKTITVSHGGKLTSLRLPGDVSSSLRLQKPVLGKLELLWRLPATASAITKDTQDVKAPWTANTLRDATDYCCRECSALFVRPGSIKSWEDLPSENWAEMMDFWHCHKPDVHDSETGQAHTDDHANRGYGANTKFLARPSVGLVDLTSFLFAQSDCTGIMIRVTEQGEPSVQCLLCKECQSYVGHLDQATGGYRLYKWRLKSTKSPQAGTTEMSHYNPSISSVISSQLHSIILAQCTSRLLLLPMDWRPKPPGLPDKESTISPTTLFLSLWVLTPFLRISTSVMNAYQSSAAMKVFWKAISANDADALVEKGKVEEVYLPEKALQEIQEELRTSVKLLPPSARKFQDWDVGLLERYEG